MVHPELGAAGPPREGSRRSSSGPALTATHEATSPRMWPDRLLNHGQGTISGVIAVYQRGQLLAERRAALEAWAVVMSG